MLCVSVCPSFHYTVWKQRYIKNISYMPQVLAAYLSTYQRLLSLLPQSICSIENLLQSLSTNDMIDWMESIIHCWWVDITVFYNILRLSAFAWEEWLSYVFSYIWTETMERVLLYGKVVFNPSQFKIKWNLSKNNNIYDSDHGLTNPTSKSWIGQLLQISAFFLFSNFRKRQIALYSPGWLVGQLTSPLIFFNI